MSSSNNSTVAMPVEQKILNMIQSKWLQYAYMLITCTVSLIFLLRFWFLSRRQGQSKLSTQLKIHVCVYMLFNFVVSLYVFPIVFWWEASKFNLVSLSLRGSANLAIGAVTAMSTGFVTIDRIYTLSFPLQSRNRWKYRLQVASAYVLVAVFLLNTNLSFWREELAHQIDISATTPCSTHGCLVGQNTVFLIFKMCIGWINVVLGIIFVYSFLRFGRKMIIRRESKKNFVVILLLINELCLNIFPTTAYVFWHTENTTTINITSLVAPAQCLDSAITTLIFWRTWRKKFEPINVRIVEPKHINSSRTSKTHPIVLSPA